MPHIKKVQVTDRNATIPKGFELPELLNLNVIIGENNSGKTNFIRAIASKSKGGLGKGKFFGADNSEITPEIIYIAAENILPTENEAKASAKTTALIKNLSVLFAGLGVNYELTEKTAISGHIKSVIKQANKNLADFTDKGPHQIAHEENNLDPATIIQSLILKISALEGKEPRKLDELGQGTQRLIIVSLLKAYADIMVSHRKDDKTPLLILFEEPEIYLHPKLKKILNGALVEIANRENHQVIISTHDPYFAYSNMYGDDSKVVSFTKNSKGDTEYVENDLLGVEDELLHIHLFTKTMEKLSPSDGSTTARSTINTTLLGMTSEKRPYCWKNNPEEDFALPVYIRHIIHHPMNNPYSYTENDLKKSIEILSGVLST